MGKYEIIGNKRISAKRDIRSMKSHEKIRNPVSIVSPPLNRQINEVFLRT